MKKTPTRNNTTLTISSKIIISIIAVVLVIIIGGLGWNTITLWRELNAPVQSKTAWNDHYQAKDFPGRTAMISVVSEAPDGVNGSDWKMAPEGHNDLNLTVLPKQCSQLAPSNARITYKTAQGGGVNTMVMVYGAGQARTQYDAYAKQLTSCGTNVQQADNIITAKGVVLMTRGDMIVSITGNDDNKIAQARDWYANKIENVLTTTSCVAKDETADDSRRSFYYNPEKYTGKTENAKVEVHDTVFQVSVPQILSVNGMDVNKAFPDPAKNDDTPSVPLSPLPKGMDSKLPSAPNLPNVPSKPNVPSSEKMVSYQVLDETGPGCGWTWAGQKAPKYDEQVIAANKATTLRNARVELQNGIKTYNRQAVNWSLATAHLMSFQSTWDAYVKKTNSIIDSWRKLNAARDELQPAWFAYVDAANEWLNWDTNVDKARSDYENALKSCQDSSVSKYKSELDTWTKQYSDLSKQVDDLNKKIQELGGSPNQQSPSQDTSTNTNDNQDTNTTDNSAELQQAFKDRDNVLSQLRAMGNAPEQPSSSQVQSACQAAVQEPVILHSQKPDRPVPPVIPSNVTLPSTWPTDPLKNTGNTTNQEQ